MILTKQQKLRERLYPALWQQGYLSLSPLLKNLTAFAALLKKTDHRKVLDLGCGVKPYVSLFPFVEKYVGFDVEEDDGVDVVGFNWDLPFAENEFDALVSTQVLEHTAKMTETIEEIKRVVKPGGLIYVSVPLTFPEHGIPYDFYRFTQFGLRHVFKDFEILSLTPHNGYLGTMMRLWNNFLFYVPGSPVLCAPFFLVNNILGVLADTFFFYFCKLPLPILGEFYTKLYMGMTESYSLVLRNKK